MINMFKAELYRLTKTKGFYLFWFLAAFIYTLTVVYHAPGGISFSAFLEFSDSLKMDIQQVALNTNYYLLLIIPTFCIICGEFSEHTVKNTITSAISKKKYYIMKSLFTMLYSLTAFITVNYLFYFVNRAVNGSKYSSAFGAFSKAMLGQLPLFTAIVSLFIFIAFTLKKGAALNAITMITPLAFSLLMMMLIEIEQTRKVAEKIMRYEISTMIGKLALDCSDSYRAKCYIICAAVTIVSLVGGYLIFEKHELE
ncbi:MAG: hypothetical protein IKI58_05915 [Oscillospiraceae bacterium]|nr:hypothetical protein [Oscillospiraceae bacterium]